mgnify:CR=1 FL=1
MEDDIVEETPLSHQAIDYLNKLTGKNFGYGIGNVKEINSQIKKGATEDNLKYVIDVKYSEWANNQDMKKNLNPITLFRESNYDRYLNQEMSLNGIVMDNYIDTRCEE